MRDIALPPASNDRPMLAHHLKMVGHLLCTPPNIITVIEQDVNHDLKGRNLFM